MQLSNYQNKIDKFMINNQNINGNNMVAAIVKNIAAIAQANAQKEIAKNRVYMKPTGKVLPTTWSNYLYDSQYQEYKETGELILPNIKKILKKHAIDLTLDEETGFIPEMFLDSNCPEKGKVSEFKPIPGSSMWTPFNYDELVKQGVKFNVILTYAGGGDPTSYQTNTKFSKNYYFNGKMHHLEYTPSDVYDNMIYYGVTDPFVLISVPYNLENAKDEKTDGEILADEYLPKIVDSIPTYAKGSDQEGMKEIKGHLTVGGFSNGAHTIYKSLMEYGSDYISDYILTSGGCSATINKLTPSLQRIKDAGKTANHIYGVVGGGGDNVPWHKASYEVAVSVFGGEENLVNCEYQTVANFGHTMGNDSFIAGLFMDIPKIWPSKNNDDEYIITDSNMPIINDTNKNNDKIDDLHVYDSIKEEGPMRFSKEDLTSPKSEEETIAEIEPPILELKEKPNVPKRKYKPITDEKPKTPKNEDDSKLIVSIVDKLNLDLIGGKGHKKDTVQKKEDGYYIVKHYENGYEANIFVPTSVTDKSNFIVDSSRGLLKNCEKTDDTIIMKVTNTILSKKHKGIYATYDIYQGKTDEEMHALGYEGNHLCGFYMPFEKEAMLKANEIVDALKNI